MKKHNLIQYPIKENIDKTTQKVNISSKIPFLYLLVYFFHDKGNLNTSNLIFISGTLWFAAYLLHVLRLSVLVPIPLPSQLA